MDQTAICQTAQPRAIGAVRISVRPRAGHTVLDGLRQQGSLRAVFPRTAGPERTAVLVNTAGGLTGGDRFGAVIEARPGTHLVMTTQAAERAYRATPGQIARVETRAEVGADARIDWLPQETLIYDGAALERRLDVRLTGTARALIVEPLVLGRLAMGERVRALHLRDRIEIRRDGRLVFADRTRIDGDALAVMAGPATGSGSAATACVILAAPDAAGQLDPVRRLLPAAAGASLVGGGLLFVRLLAEDGFGLRTHLVPLIRHLTGRSLPRTWMI